MSATSQPVIGFETRFLLPFLFRYDQMAALLDHFQAMSWHDRAVWQLTTPCERYTDNLLPFLRLLEGNRSSTRTGSYLRLNSDFEANLFSTEQPDDSVDLVKRNGIEIFLRPYGTAVVSVCLTSSQPKTLAQIRDWNQRLHFGHHWIAKAPDRMLPLSIHLPGALPTPSLLYLPQLLDRLTSGAVPGGDHSEAFGIVPLQRSCNVYTSVRLPSEVDFQSQSNRDDWAPQLAGLRGIWPSSHCGASLDSMTGDAVPLLLNHRHWMAVGHHGAAHLVCDQPDEHGTDATQFNQQRLEIASDKMFMQYLLALMQRMAMQAFTHEALEITRDADPDHPMQSYEKLQPLRTTLTHYGLEGFTSQLSDEDNSSRVFRACQKTLGVHESMNHLNRVLADVDRQLRSEQQMEMAQATNRNVLEQLHLQEKVEWLEVFIVTVYSVKLAHYLGEAFAPHATAVHTMWYPGLTLVWVGIVTLLVMLSVLHMWPEKSAGHSIESDPDRPKANDNAKQRMGPWTKQFGRCLVELGRVGEKMVRGRRRWALLWIFASIGLHIGVGLIMQKH